MRSAGILAITVVLVFAWAHARAGIDLRTVSDSNGRVVVELTQNDNLPASLTKSFFAAVSTTGTYQVRYRVGPAVSTGTRTEAGVALDSVVVSPPFPLRGTRMIWITARVPSNTPVSTVTIDYTPATLFNDAAGADPIIKSMVVNRDVFPTTARAAATDPWFTRAPFWVKLTVSTRGMYAVSGADLAAAGITLSTVDPNTLRVFSSGGLNQPRAYADPNGSWQTGKTMREVPVRVDAGGDGTFDPNDRVYFYGIPTHDWADYYDASLPDTLYQEHTHAKANVYFLAWGGSLGGSPARIGDLAAGPVAAADVTTYRHREYRERDLFSDFDFRGDGWLWLNIGNPGNKFSLLPVDARNLVTSRPQTFRTIALAKYVSPLDITGSNIGHHATYWIDRTPQDFLVAEHTWNGNSGDSRYETGRPVRVSGSFLVEGNNTFLFQVPGDLNAKDKQLFAFFSVWYQRRLIAVGNAAGFTSPDTTGTPNFNVDGFTGGDVIHAFDVTDPWNPTRLTTFEESSSTRGRRVRFSSPHAGNRHHYWVATTSAMLRPTIARFTPNDLRADASAPNLLIITHRDFRAAADRLRAYRAAGRVPFVDNPRVEVVTCDDIFDNFSQGLPDPMALRNYIKYLYDNYPDAHGNPALAYVCFLGDASLDFQNRATTQPDFVPSNLNLALQAPYTHATDDWYAHMDIEDQVAGRDMPDLAIGRLPASSPAEADFLVQRVIDYETASPNEKWRNELVLVADDEHSGFERCETEWTDESEVLSFYNVPNFIDVTKVYLIEYPLIVGVKPTSRFRFLDEWNDGVLMISYIGHGSSQQMADEQVFLQSDVTQLSNGLKLPMMMAFSCTIGDFANPAGKCLSENLLLHEGGGAIAALTASTESFPGANGALNKGVFERLLPQHLGGPIPSLGVGMLQAKAHAQMLLSSSPFAAENHWKYNLLGDPACTLRVPRRDIRFETAGNDTLVAGARATVRGRVYRDGQPDPGYNGTVTVTMREPVLNKLYTTTCATPHDTIPPPIIHFRASGGVMYEGTADVTNGAFEVNFRVPRYAGTGPMAPVNAYATRGMDDGAGNMDSVLVVVAPTPADSTDLKAVDGAPRVELGFKSGLSRVKIGDTVLARVRDADGINILATTNEGKQAILIDALPIPIDVNEFFTFDHGGIDTSGTMEFPLPELAVGPHRLVYKVSDAFGSTTLDTLAFDVTDAEDYYAEAVLNYPNPFQTSTQLLFRLSNRASIKLDIYTVSGKRVRTLTDRRDGGEVWLEWDGRDASGGDLANGTYLYVATVDFEGIERAPLVLRGKMAKIR